MAVYDLNRGELNALLAIDKVDPSVRKAVIDYLVDDGAVGRGGRAEVQVGDAASLDPNAQVLIVDGTSPTTVDTSTDPNLKVIVDTDGAPLTLTGSTDVFVALGSGNDTVDGSAATGNNVFMTGGNDHAFDWLLDGSDPHGGFDTAFGGLGIEDDGSKAHGGGNDSLTGGSGDDLFALGRTGNDTVNGGGGNDTVAFDDSSANASISVDNTGATIVHFSDTGQTMTITGVENLVFTDTGHK